MDMETRKYLEKGLKAIVVPSPEDKDLFTVVYVIDVPGKNPKEACEEASNVMRAQLNYHRDGMGGPAFSVIDPDGKITDIDYNEVDESGLDGSVTEQ